MAPIDRYLPAWTGALWEQVAGPAQELQQQARGVSDLRLLLEALQAEMADLADLAMAWLAEEQDPLSGLPAGRQAAQASRAVPVSGVPDTPGQPRSDAAPLLRRQLAALESDASTMPDQPAVDFARHRFLRQLAGAATGSAPELTATSPVSAGSRQRSAPAEQRHQAAAIAWDPAQSRIALPIPFGSEPESAEAAVASRWPVKNSATPSASAGPEPRPAGAAAAGELGRLLAFAHPAGEPEAGSSQGLPSVSGPASLAPGAQRLARLTERWPARRPAAGIEAATRRPQGVPMPAIASAPTRSPAAIPRLQPSGQVATADPMQPLAQWIVLRSASPAFAALAAAAQSPVGAAPSSVGRSVAGARLRQLAALSRPVETSPQASTAEATVAPAPQAAKARVSGTFVRPVAELDLSATPTHAVAEVGFAGTLVRPADETGLAVSSSHPAAEIGFAGTLVRPADEPGLAATFPHLAAEIGFAGMLVRPADEPVLAATFPHLAAEIGSAGMFAHPTDEVEVAAAPSEDLLIRLTERWFRRQSQVPPAGQAPEMPHPWLGNVPQQVPTTPQGREATSELERVSGPEAMEQSPARVGDRLPLGLGASDLGSGPSIQLNVQPPLALDQFDPDALAEMLGQVLRREARRHGIPLF